MDAWFMFLLLRPQECMRAAGALLIKGSDPTSEDGQRLEKSQRELEKVGVLPCRLLAWIAACECLCLVQIDDESWYKHGQRRETRSSHARCCVKGVVPNVDMRLR